MSIADIFKSLQAPQPSIPPLQPVSPIISKTVGGLADNVLSSLSEAVLVVDRDLGVRFMNQSAQELIGLVFNEAAGVMPWNEVCGDALFVDEFIGLTDQFLRQIWQTGKSYLAGMSSNTYLQTKSLKKIPITLSAVPFLKSGQVEFIIVTIRDISQEKQTQLVVEQRLKNQTQLVLEEQARMKASINSLNLGLIMTDQNSNALIINDAAKLLLCSTALNQPYGAYDNSNFRNKSCSLDDIQERLSKYLDLKALIKKSFTEEKPIDIKDFQFNNMILHIQIRPIIFLAERIEVLGAVIMIDDVTKERTQERSKDEFFSIASHELRTPLTAIRGNTMLIKEYFMDKLQDKDLVEMINDIHESSVRLIEIVNDFLDTSRLEQSRMQFKNADFDINELIESCMKELSPVTKERNIALLFENEAQVIPPVFADKDRVKQVLLNLLGNAIKFTTVGGVSVEVQVLPAKVKVIIKDSGKGIGLPNQALLFRKFQQAQDNILTRDTTRGTGLGLYISKLLIENMGGTINLESSVEGKGSVFAFTLPLATGFNKPVGKAELTPDPALPTAQKVI